MSWWARQFQTPPVRIKDPVFRGPRVFAIIFPARICRDFHRLECPSVRRRTVLHLCEAPIHREFRAGNITAVIAGQKYHCLGDFIGRA